MSQWLNVHICEQIQISGAGAYVSLGVCCTGWFCVSTWHSWSYHREKSFRWGNASMRSSCKSFSQLVIKAWRALCGWHNLWAGCLGFYKKASWASQGEQASKQHPSMASTSALAFWPAWVSVLTSFDDQQQCGKCKLSKSFPPQLASWSWCLCRKRNLDQDTHYGSIFPTWILQLLHVIYL